MYIQRTFLKTHFVNGSWKFDLAAQTKITTTSYIKTSDCADFNRCHRTKTKMFQSAWHLKSLCSVEENPRFSFQLFTVRGV